MERGKPPATNSAATSAPSVPNVEMPAAAVDVTDVRRVWNEVLAAVQRHRRTTQILLASATVVDVSGATLHLTMPAAGMAKRVVEPANADLLRAALKEVLGVDWVIRCDAPGGPGAGLRSPAAQLSPRTNQPKEPLSDLVAPPEEEEIPDDYGHDADPSSPRAAVRDPEDLAIELLTSQLGAKRLDAQG